MTAFVAVGASEPSPILLRTRSEAESILQGARPPSDFQNLNRAAETGRLLIGSYPSIATETRRTASGPKGDIARTIRSGRLERHIEALQETPQAATNNWTSSPRQACVSRPLRSATWGNDQKEIMLDEKRRACLISLIEWNQI